MITQHINVHKQFKEKHALQAERQHVTISHNPSTINENEDLEVKVPVLGVDDVIIPSSLELTFDIDLTSAANTRHVVNNLGKAIVTKLIISYEGNEIQSIQDFDVFQIYNDMWKTKHDQSLLISQGLDDEGNINKIRSGANGAIAAASAKEKAVAAAYSKKFSIPIGSYFELTKHLPTVMINDRLSFILHFASYGSVINDPGTGTGQSAKPADGTYSISKISLEFDKVTDASKANETRVELTNLSLPFERLHHYKTLHTLKNADTAWNIGINMSSKSLAGVILLFKEKDKLKKYSMKHSEFYNPLITAVEITAQDIPNRLYTHGMNSTHLYKSAYGYFGSENTAMDIGNFFTTGYCLFVDFRTIANNKLHGGGMALLNSGDGINLAITKKADTAGDLRCYIFTIEDAQLNFNAGRFLSLIH